MGDPVFEGGCLCGQVRWRATAPPANVRVCHCPLCQRWTGAPFFARAVFLAEDFAWAGATTGWPTSERIVRRSCARCGTPLLSAPNDPPARIGVSVATCDDPHALGPTVHIWTSSKVDWLSLDDGLPQCLEGYVAPG